MTSKSPIKDYSRLLGVDRTVKKEENLSRLRLFDTSERIADELITCKGVKHGYLNVTSTKLPPIY